MYVDNCFFQTFYTVYGFTLQKLKRLYHFHILILNNYLHALVDARASCSRHASAEAMAAGGVAEVLQAVQALHAHANPETTRQADESAPPFAA